MDLHQTVRGQITHLLRTNPRVIVGVDGPDAAGKTTFADALAEGMGLPSVRASIDSFHNPRAIRMARGELSPEGFYLDSFNHDALQRDLLDPFRCGASQVQVGQFDYRTNTASNSFRAVSEVAVLVLDGVFLMRSSLRGNWDVSVYLHVAPDETLRRALVRDVADLGGESEVRRKYEARYLPGQALYREEADPLNNADIVVDNTDPNAPRLLRSPVACDNTRSL